MSVITVKSCHSRCHSMFTTMRQMPCSTCHMHKCWTNKKIQVECNNNETNAMSHVTCPDLFHLPNSPLAIHGAKLTAVCNQNKTTLFCRESESEHGQAKTPHLEAALTETASPHSPLPRLNFDKADHKCNANLKSTCSATQHSSRIHRS